MEQLTRQHTQIKKLVDQAVSTELNMEEMSALKAKLQEQWTKFKATVDQLQDDTKTTAAAQTVVALETQTRAMVDQALANLTTKMEALTALMTASGVEERSDENTEQDESLLSQTKPTERTAPAHPPPLESVKPSPKQYTDDEVDQQIILSKLLEHITAHFSDILAGKYEKPATTTSKCEADTNPRQDANKHHVSHSSEAGPSVSAADQCTTDKTGTDKSKSAAHLRSRIDAMKQLPSVELKLDKIQLPTFDGDLTQWIAFRDQYIDLVHENPKLTTITKFCQLRSHLSGLALDAINGFSLTSTDYEAAWFVLRKRYDKKDRIIDEYLRKFEELPQLTHPNAVKLINMVNRTNQLIRVMPLLGVEVKTWDTWIKFNLKTRLDKLTHRKWLDQIKLRQDVTLQELLEFLEVEASECVPIEYEPQRHVQRRSTARQAPKRFQNKRNPTTMLVAQQAQQKQAKEQQRASSNKPPQRRSCEQCKEEHFLYLCPTFLALKVTDRIKKVKEFGICFRCLRVHKHPADCKFGACPVCKKDHNSALCYKKEKENQDIKKPAECNVANVTADDWQ